VSDAFLNMKLDNNSNENVKKEEDEDDDFERD
jgi:hypothetical protein